MQVTWKDGRLAAKQLFDGLRTLGINPANCRFNNVFRTTFDPKPLRKPWLKRMLLRAINRGEVIVAMGNRVSSLLTALGIPHHRIVHPAARGKIRLKAAYAAHLREAFKEFGT